MSSDHLRAESFLGRGRARGRRRPGSRTYCARSTARPRRPTRRDRESGHGSRPPPRGGGGGGGGPSAEPGGGGGGGWDAVGSSSRSRCVGLSMALASATRVCSPEDRAPHFMFRSVSRSNWRTNALIRSDRPLTLDRKSVV